MRNAESTPALKKLDGRELTTGRAADDIREELQKRFRDIFADAAHGREHRQESEATIARLLVETVSVLTQRLAAIEKSVADVQQLLRDREPTKEWYTVAEAAKMLGRAEFTVREWCRMGRVYASKRACGRGPTQEWIIANTEIERIRNEGILPM